MSTTLDGSVAVLWGSATREVNWVHLDPKHGRVSVANARATGFWVRDLHGAPGMDGIAEKAWAAWQLLREERDLEGWATHRLAPPYQQDIEPIPVEVKA